jgi:hypothetical protein
MSGNKPLSKLTTNYAQLGLHGRRAADLGQGAEDLGAQEGLRQVVESLLELLA